MLECSLRRRYNGSTNATVYPFASIVRSNASTFWIEGDVVSGQTTLRQAFTMDGGLANTGNTMAPCVVIGEQAAAFLQEEHRS